VKLSEDMLREILGKNRILVEILNRLPALSLPNSYLAAGCIAQTVWNKFHDFQATAHIKDYDIVYYDDSDLSFDHEDFAIRNARGIFSDIPAEVEVRNEARVHVWYEKRFGYAIKPYTSIEDAIASFPCTATSIGVRNEGGQFTVNAPFGLDDIFSLTVRPNKRQVTKEIYMQKATRWKEIWPKLTVIPWD
jgi:uncharacterized protein